MFLETLDVSVSITNTWGNMSGTFCIQTSY